MFQKRILEIACFNPESALIAEKAGADRIEFCTDYSSGGLSPSGESILYLRERLSIGLYVMIRPRSGDFFYSEKEFLQMKNEILFCKKEGCDGVVLGILNEKNEIDLKRCEELVELAKPMKSSFHRAFDKIENSNEALETLIGCGFSRVLTSGKKETALEGAGLLSALISQSKERITVMPGGGIRSENVSEIIKKTGAKEFHSAALNKDTQLADADEITRIIMKMI